MNLLNRLYKKLSPIYAGLFLCFFLLPFSVCAKKDAEKTKVYEINEMVFEGEKPIIHENGKDRVFKNIAEKIKAMKAAEKQNNLENIEAVSYEIKGESVNSEYNRDDDYSESEHPYIDLAIETFNKIPPEQKSKLIKSGREILKHKDEIIEKASQFFSETFPNMQKEILEKVRFMVKGEKGPYEIGLISEPIKHENIETKIYSCSSHIHDGVMTILLDFLPKFSIVSGNSISNLKIEVVNSENVAKNEINYMLPDEDGNYYTKTRGVLLFRAKNLDKDSKIKILANYDICIKGRKCTAFHDFFDMIVPKPTDKIAPFTTSYCQNLSSVLNAIPKKEFSAIKIVDKFYDEKNKTAEFLVSFDGDAYNPFIYYYDKDSNNMVYGTAERKGNLIKFVIPFKKGGIPVKFTVRDREKGLEFQVDSLPVKNDLAKVFSNLYKTMEKGLLLNILSPALILLFAFLSMFADFGQGKVEKVKIETKKVLKAIGIVFLSFASIFGIMAGFDVDFVYGRQFCLPYINLLVLSAVLYYAIKFEKNTFMLALLLMPLFIICPFMGIDKYFDFFYDKGVVYIIIAILSMGLGMAIPYIVFLLLPEYVVIFTSVNSIFYQKKYLRWIPVLFFVFWYVIVSVLSIASMHKKGGEEFSLSRLEQLRQKDTTVFISVSANSSLSSMISRLVVLNNTRKSKVLRADYFDKKTRTDLKRLGLDSPNKSLFLGKSNKGGHIIEGVISAGEPNKYIIRVSN